MDIAVPTGCSSNIIVSFLFDALFVDLSLYNFQRNTEDFLNKISAEVPRSLFESDSNLLSVLYKDKTLFQTEKEVWKSIFVCLNFYLLITVYVYRNGDSCYFSILLLI